MRCKKMKLGFTPHRHAESSLLSICSGFKKQGVDPEQKLFRMTLCNIGGFTLIEVIVVVLIIAVLTAVAVPMYKRAVLKSRFSTVMPMAKSVADAQEIYYLGNGYYAQNDQKDLLDISNTDVEKTAITLSGKEGYDYVLAQRTDVPELHYIMYQRNSENYPGEIHCEAQDDNANAQYVCKSFGGTLDIGSTLTRGYTTYVISGTGLGLAPGSNAPNCKKADTMEGYTCTLDTNAQGQTVKRVCTTTAGGTNVCRTNTYNEDGSYTSVTCYTQGSGSCYNTGDSIGLLEDTYDEDGRIVKSRICGIVDTSGECKEWSQRIGGKVYEYDGNTVIIYSCKYSSCTSYAGATKYTYDSEGNLLTKQACSSSSSSFSTCSSWASPTYYVYENGQLVRKGSEESAPLQKGTVVYGYNTAGQLVSMKTCWDASCSYQTSSNRKSIEYEGNTVKIININANGTNGTTETYTLDDEGHLLVRGSPSELKASNFAMWDLIY